MIAQPKDLKALVVDVWGPGALSLGTTAVERAWWPDHVRNMNRTARRVWKVVTVLQHEEECRKKAVCIVAGGLHRRGGSIAQWLRGSTMWSWYCGKQRSL